MAMLDNQSVESIRIPHWDVWPHLYFNPPGSSTIRAPSAQPRADPTHKVGNLRAVDPSTDLPVPARSTFIRRIYWETQWKMDLWVKIPWNPWERCEKLEGIKSGKLLGWEVSLRTSWSCPHHAGLKLHEVGKQALEKKWSKQILLG